MWRVRGVKSYQGSRTGTCGWITSFLGSKTAFRKQQRTKSHEVTAQVCPSLHPPLRVSGPRGSPAYLESRIATRRIYYDLIDSSILRYEIYLPICKYSKLHDDRR